jgi:RNA polymerase sigma-70 factor (ECF subfamily)
MSEHEDTVIAQLVASSKHGDSAAMEILIRRYQSRVAGFVFAYIGDGQAVGDLCQTIFCKMLVGLRRLRETARFESWLFRIARNVCLDHLRRRRLSRIFVPWHSADRAADAAVPAVEGFAHRVEALRRALLKLPNSQRELRWPKLSDCIAGISPTQRLHKQGTKILLVAEIHMSLIL